MNKMNRAFERFEAVMEKAMALQAMRLPPYP